MHLPTFPVSRSSRGYTPWSYPIDFIPVRDFRSSPDWTDQPDHATRSERGRRCARTDERAGLPTGVGFRDPDTAEPEEQERRSSPPARKQLVKSFGGRRQPEVEPCSLGTAMKKLSKRTSTALQFYRDFERSFNESTKELDFATEENLDQLWESKTMGNSRAPRTTKKRNDRNEQQKEDREGQKEPARISMQFLQTEPELLHEAINQVLTAKMDDIGHDGGRDGERQAEAVRRLQRRIQLHQGNLVGLLSTVGNERVLLKDLLHELRDLKEAVDPQKPENRRLFREYEEDGQGSEEDRGSGQEDDQGQNMN